MSDKLEQKPPCLKILEDHDPTYGKAFGQLFKSTFSPGALDVKTKMLIAMGINASTGMGYGCSEIAKILEREGTTKGEISEALRVSSTVRAIQGVVTGSEVYI
jgi:alkylhydroperoxidase/carboxymuconolactone decarboxylase family protein YurZ